MESSRAQFGRPRSTVTISPRSEEHTSELQSHLNLVCRLLLEKKRNDQAASRYIDPCPAGVSFHATTNAIVVGQALIEALSRKAAAWMDIEANFRSVLSYPYSA